MTIEVSVKRRGGLRRKEDEFEWTPERVAQLRTLWADPSLSALDMARQLGVGVSRNSVLGKGSRLRLGPRKYTGAKKRAYRWHPEAKPAPEATIASVEGATCPCCGAALRHAPSIDGLEFIPLPKAQRRVLSVLIDTYPQAVRRERLAEIIWAEEENGGPTSAASSVSVLVHRLRPKLETLGWSIGSGVNGKAGIKLWPLGVA